MGCLVVLEGKVGFHEKKHAAPPIETRSVRPCFNETLPAGVPTTSTKESPPMSSVSMHSQYSDQPTVCDTPAGYSAVLGHQSTMASGHRTQGVYSTNATTRSGGSVHTAGPSSMGHSTSQPSFQTTQSTTSVDDEPTVLSRHPSLVSSSTSSATPSAYSATPSACSATPSVTAGKGPSVSSTIASGFGIVVGGSVNITSPSQSFVNTSTSRHAAEFPGPLSSIHGSTTGNIHSNPFILKFKTNQIKICQSCRKNYDAQNDTMGLVVARAERRMVSNLATGTQFLGRESNSHYHAHMWCLKKASNSFEGSDLVIDEAVKARLTPFQKIYLVSCLQVPNL